MPDFFHNHALTLLIFSPFVGAVILALLPKSFRSGPRVLGFFFSLIPFLISLWLDRHHIPSPGFAFKEVAMWIPSFQIFYRLGADGLTLSLALLTTLTLPIAILFSWGSVREREKEYYFFLLLLESAMLGAFFALDLMLFYLFWEVMLVPMYFLIGIWGGKRRIYATMKFFIYTMLGSVLMLVAILYLSLKMGGSFDYEVLLRSQLNREAQILLFCAFALSFAIKVPMFPLHTWLPDAHVEAPTAGSVILAGILLKMGAYGFLRFAIPLFPQGFFFLQPVLALLAVMGIVYGALLSIVQADIKKLVAYSSISHLGFVMLGLFSMTHQGVQGAIYQMLNHGVSTGALFLLVGMLYDRRHSRQILDFGGIARVMPVYTTIFLIVTLSSIAVPGTNGFIGEFLILLGSFNRFPIHTIVASSGVIFAAVYMLWMVQRVFFGPLVSEENRALKDLNLRELLVLLPFVVLIFWMGLFPNSFLGKFDWVTRLFVAIK